MLGCAGGRKGCTPSASRPHSSSRDLGGAPGGILLLGGPVGNHIAALELRYEDGRIANVPLYHGWALYEVNAPTTAKDAGPQS